MGSANGKQIAGKGQQHSNSSRAQRRTSGTASHITNLYDYQQSSTSFVAGGDIDNPSSITVQSDLAKYLTWFKRIAKHGLNGLVLFIEGNITPEEVGQSSWASDRREYFGKLSDKLTKSMGYSNDEIILLYQDEKMMEQFELPDSCICIPTKMFDNFLMIMYRILIHLRPHQRPKTLLMFQDGHATMDVGQSNKMGREIIQYTINTLGPLAGIENFFLVVKSCKSSKFFVLDKDQKESKTQKVIESLGPKDCYDYTDKNIIDKAAHDYPTKRFLGISTAYHDTSCWHSTILGETLLDAITISDEITCRDLMDFGHAAQGFLREQNPNCGLEVGPQVVFAVTPTGELRAAPDLDKYHRKHWKTIPRERWCALLFFGKSVLNADDLSFHEFLSARNVN